MFVCRSFIISIITWFGFVHAHGAIDIFPIPDTIACSYFVLPAIAGSDLTGAEAYFSAPSGNGQMYLPGDTLFSSAVVYAYDDNGAENDEACFYVQVVSNLPDLGDIVDDTACQYKILPYFTTPSVSGFAGYYTAPQTNGVRFQQGDTLWYSAQLFVYDGYPDCYVEKEIFITIDTLSVFDSIPPQYGCREYELIPFPGQHVLSDQVYFTNGSTIYHPGDLLHASQTLTAYAPNGVCTAEKEFELIVIDHLELDLVSDTLICDFSLYPLPTITGPSVTSGASYFEFPGGNGKQFEVGGHVNVANHPILYIYDSIPGSDCVDETVWQIHVTPEPNARREFTATVCRGYTYRLDTLLLRRNSAQGNNFIVPIAGNPQPPGDLVFQTALFSEGTYLFYVIDTTGFPCIPDTAIMTVISTDNCTNLDFTEIYCVYNQSSELFHLSVNLEKDPSLCLGGQLVELDGTPFKNWDERIFVDLRTPDTLVYFYILTDPAGNIDTSIITIQLQDYILIPNKLAGPDTLCKGECTYFQIGFLDDDEYLPAWDIESVDTSLAYEIFMYREKFTRTDTLWFCFLNGKMNESDITPDTIFLPAGNQTYTARPWFIGNLKDCQREDTAYIRITTRDENTFHFEETHCAGSVVDLFGETFSESRPEGEIKLDEPAVNGCDSFIYVRLSFYTPAIARYEQTLCYDDTVIINCIAYTKDFASDTQYLPGLGIYGCDSVIIVDLRFTSVSEFYLDTTLCVGETFEFAGLSLDTAGITTGSIQGINLCDSLLYTIQIEVVPIDTASIIVKNPICPETPGLLSIDADYESLIWSTGDTSANVTINSPGIYVVTVTDENGCSQVVETFLADAVEFSVTGDHLYVGMPGQQIPFMLQIIGELDSIRWTPAIGLDCISCLNPVATVMTSQLFDYTAVDVNGCVISGSVTVNIEIEEKTFVPNIFYPYSDIPGNRVFSVFTSPASKPYSLSVFDRWGNAVFHKENLQSNDISSSWNGTSNGKLVQSGVYAYSIVFEDSPEVLTGSVTVIY